MPGGTEPASSSSRQRNDRRKRRPNTPSSLLALIATLSAAIASSCIATAAEAAVSTGHDNNVGRQRPQQNRLLSIPSQQQRRANDNNNATKTEETNDDKFTIIDLLSFELRISNIPISQSSPVIMKSAVVVDDNADAPLAVAAVSSTEMLDPLVEHIHYVVETAFRASVTYGDRFDAWNAGEIVAVVHGDSSPEETAVVEPAVEEQPVDVVEPASSAADPAVARDETSGVQEAWASVAEAAADADSEVVDEGAGTPETVPAAAAAVADGKRWLRGLLRGLVDVPPEEATAIQQGGSAVATTATLSVQGGDVTFAGPVYWDRDPTPRELTEFVVSELGSPENGDDILAKLRPMVCSAEEIIGMECDIGFELAFIAMSDDGVDVQDAEVPAVGGDIEANGEEAAAVDPGQGAAGGETTPNDPSANGESEGTATNPTDPADAVAAIEASSPEDTIPHAKDDGGGSNDDLKWIVPVAVGASLIAFALAALLFVRHRKKKRNDTEEEEEEEENGVIIKMNVTAESDDIVPDLLPPAQWANRAYDNITKPPAVAAVPRGEGGKAPQAALEKQQPKSKIDDILEDMSDDDGDSSFVSDSSAGGDASTATGLTGLTGLTGILGDGPPGSSPTPLDDDARNGSKLSKVSTDGAGVDGGDGIPKTVVQKISSSSGGAASNNVSRKGEDFEDTYRTRSAMAKLNLKKDILHVGDETHDAPDEEQGNEEGGSTVVPGSEGAVGGGGADGMNIHFSAQAAGAGISRTISPKKSTNMMEKQRQKEKQWMSGRKSSGRGGNTGGGNDRSLSRKEQQEVQQIPKDSQSVNSQDLILPVSFRRSDSSMRSGGSGSDQSEEDYSDMV